MRSWPVRALLGMVAKGSQADLFSLPLLAFFFLLLQFAPGLVRPGDAMPGWALYLTGVSIALLCFSAGSHVGIRCGGGLVHCWRNAPNAWNSRAALMVGIGAFTGGFLLKLRHCEVHGLREIVCALAGSATWAPNLLHRIAICVVLLAILASHGRRRYWALSFCLVAYLSWSVVAGAGRFELVASFVSLCAVLWYRGGHSLRWPLLLLLLAAVPAFLGKSWIKYADHLAAEDWGALGFLPFVYDAVFARISQHQIVGAILEQWALGPLGLYGWQDFFNALLSQPLRYLDGNDLGKAFSVLGRYEFSTGVGPTFVGDFYLKGGFLGIAVGMVGVGLIYGALSALVRGRPSQSVVLLYASLLPVLVHGMEDWFFLSMARALQATFLCILLIAAIAWLPRFIRKPSQVLAQGGAA